MRRQVATTGWGRGGGRGSSADFITGSYFHTIGGELRKKNDDDDGKTRIGIEIESEKRLYAYAFVLNRDRESYTEEKRKKMKVEVKGTRRQSRKEGYG